MRRSIGLGLCVAGMLCLALAGCGGGGRRDAFVDRLPLPPDTMTVAMDELGGHGGRIVMGSTSGPKTFNPVMANESTSNEIIGLLFTALTDIDYRTQTDVPALAKSWEFGDGDLAVTFHLRRGACFSDGHPITSEDVKFSYDVVMSPDIPSAIRSALSSEVGGESVPYAYSAPDSYTFVVRARRPDALMLAHCSSVRIMPRHVLGPAFAAGRFPSAYGTGTPPESLVTSGPFRLEAYASNERTVLTRNPRWFGVDARGRRLPYLDQVVFLVAGDQESAALKFRAKELDGLDNLKPEDYRGWVAAQAKLGFTLHDVGPSLNTSFFYFNLNRVRKPAPGRKAGAPFVEPYKFAWFSNPGFRRALSHAVDRQSIIRGPMAGFGVPGWSVMTPGSPQWYDSTVTGADYDPAKAKAMLDGLGLVDRNGDSVREDAQGHPVTFTMLYNGDNKLRAAMALLLQDDFAKVGVRLVPTSMDFNTLVSHTRNDFQYESCLGGLGSAVPADPAMGANFWKSSGISHYWDVAQPEGHPDTPAEARLDALFDQHVSTLDRARRKATYREMSQLLNDECFVIWLPTTLMRVAVSNRFGNIHPSPMMPRILWDADRIFVRRPGGAA